ncbi:MAG: primosomal protein N' [Anaerolineae bacterium]|nr:primosomal protein N' [Anaerolineae bacterium]
MDVVTAPARILAHKQAIAKHLEKVKPGKSGGFREYSEDAMTAELPPVRLVDMRQELKAGNRSVFSRALQESLGAVLEARQQAILFLNRRGAATYVFCRDCGYVMRCPRCDEAPLTFHRVNRALFCHRCGYKRQQPKTCPECKSSRIRYYGMGTEQVEEEVLALFPHARTLRWDRDTTKEKGSHEIILRHFANHQADVLVGTQMLAKGLDLPLVTLVGVISADVSLGLPDYRTGERAFQILAQVAGRAGRGVLGGRVIVQTYQPEHYAIQAAAEHDFASFYIEEIRFRTQHSLPPFRRLARLLYIDPVNERGEREAQKLAKALRLHIREKALGATEILGPTPPFFNRVDGRYRWQLLIRSPDPVRLLEDFAVPRPWLVDIDPVSTL